MWGYEGALAREGVEAGGRGRGVVVVEEGGPVVLLAALAALGAPAAHLLRAPCTPTLPSATLQGNASPRTGYVCPFGLAGRAGSHKLTSAYLAFAIYKE